MSLDKLRESYWTSKAFMARSSHDQEESSLIELQEREQAYIERLRQSGERTRALESELAALKLGQPLLSATSASATDARVAELESELASVEERHRAELAREGESSGAFLLTKLSDVEAEADSLRQQLSQLQMDNLVAAAAAPSVAPAGAGGSGSDEAMLEAARARVASLEQEIDTLESDYETVSERLDVQAETITLANGRLDEVAEALQSQALKAEEELQRTAAFWIARLGAAKAGVADAPPPARVETPTSKASEADADADAQLRAQLEEQAQTAEEELQRTAAFWIAKLSEARTEAADAPRLRAELETLKQKAEEELQRTAAFWIARANGTPASPRTLPRDDTPTSAVAAPAPSSQLEIELEEARAALANAEQQREIDVQKTSAYWIDRLADVRKAAGDVAAVVNAPAADDAVEKELTNLEADLEATLQALSTTLDELDIQAQTSEEELQRTAAFWIAKLSEAKAEAAEAPRLRAQLQTQTQKAEQELQRTAAFWIAQLGAAKAQLAAASESDMQSQASINLLAMALESQAQTAEEDLQRTAAFWVARLGEAKAKATDTPQIQAQLDTLARAADDDVELLEAELAMQAQKAEEALQRTSAFWIGRLAEAQAGEGEVENLQEDLEDTLEALDATLEELEEQAQTAEEELQRTAAFWIAKLSEAKAQLAAASESDLQNQASINLLAMALESQAQTAEEDLQRTAAFWVAKLESAKKQAPPPSAAAEPAAKDGDGSSAESDRYREVIAAQSEKIRTYETEMASAALSAEGNLQSTSAFWLARDSKLREQLRQSEALNGELRAALAKSERAAEVNLQATSAFWVSREKSRQATQLNGKNGVAEAPAGATTVDPVEALTEAMSENLSKWLRGD